MKMKIWICILMIFASASCKNYLDVKPSGQVLPETAEEFSAMLHEHLNNIDYALENSILGDAYSVLYYECYTDNLDMNLLNSPGLPLYVGSKINNFQEVYEELYSVIRDCNLVIDNLKERETELGHKVLGTAYSLRSVCYYNLLRLFCEPYNREIAGSMLGLSLVDRFDMEAKPVRSDLRTTVAFIEDSFKKALEHKVTDPLYRFTEDVVKAYLAKLYFWVQDWENARLLAAEVLEKYPLCGAAAWREMIQERYGQRGNILIRSYLFAGGADWDYVLARNDALKCRVSKEFINLFTEKEADIRYEVSFDQKRQNVKNIGARVRSAELCLMIAECYAHEGNVRQALFYLNLLRENRITGVVPYTEATLPEVGTEDLITTDATGEPLTRLMAAILRERRKELYMEGDRWFELKRNGRPEFWIGNDGLKYETKRFLYTAPIPKFDVGLGVGIIQNEGYES